MHSWEDFGHKLDSNCCDWKSPSGMCITSHCGSKQQ